MALLRTGDWSLLTNFTAEDDRLIMPQEEARRLLE